MTVSKFTKILFTYSFVCEFILIYAVDKLFFLYRGVDLAGIAVMIAVSSTLVIILEVPSGALADRWNRKNVLIIACLLRIICFIIWLFSTNLSMFILGSAFLVAGYTFESGTLQAYIYDFLKMHGQEDNFEKVLGRGVALRVIGIAVALSLGGFLSTRSYELTVGLSAAGPLLGAIVLFFFPDDLRQTVSETKSYFHILRNGIRKAFSDRVLLRVFLYSAIVMAGCNIMDEYIPVLLADHLGFSNTIIGIWLAIGVGLASIGSLLAHRLKTRNWDFLLIMVLVLGVLLSMILITRSPVILGTLILFYLFSVTIGTLLEGIIQRNIDAEERATITSVNSFVTEGGVIIFGLVFGFVANRYGIHIGYGLYGALFFVFGIVLLIRRVVQRG